MELTVEYYGMLESVCGTRRERVSLQGDGVTVAAAMERLEASHEGLGQHRKHVAFAVDDELVGEDAALRDGSVLALLPPVSGG